MCNDNDDDNKGNGATGDEVDDDGDNSMGDECHPEESRRINLWRAKMDY